MAITFVAGGASSATNGSAPTPGLPSGLAAGDVMVCAFYSREIVDGTVSISSGWTQIINQRSASGLLAAWFRVFQSGDAAPTLTLGGHATGSSGDSAIAQIAAWRGCDQVDPLDVTGTITDTVLAQNIESIAGITLAANDAVIVLGDKRDDWTSVATLSGDSLTWNEIGEPDTTSGADAGMVWDYAIDGGSGTTVTAKTFTVTGGASAAGKGVMFSLNVAPPAQTISGAGAIGSAEAFGSAKLNLGVSAAGAIASAEAFGTGKLNLAIAAAGSVASAETFGTPTVSTGGGAQTISGAGAIATAEAFGTAALSAVQAVAGAGKVIRRRVFVSLDDVRPAPPEARAIRAAGIASAEAFGRPAVTSMSRLAPAPIAPRSEVGSPALRLRRPRALRRAEERGLLLMA